MQSAESVLAAIRFDANGLVPAVAQQHDTGEVLMMAWMNRDAVAETLATGRVCYFSRSRNALWRKGETSGQAQHLKELRVDCDGDTLLLLVDQQGVACHTGRRSLFLSRRARRRAGGDRGTAGVARGAVRGRPHARVSAGGLSWTRNVVTSAGRGIMARPGPPGCPCRATTMREGRRRRHGQSSPPRCHHTAGW